MSFVFTPRYKFDCPGCGRSLPAHWSPGIGFDDDGTLLCVDCLNGSEIAEVLGHTAAKYGSRDQPNLAGVPTNSLGRPAPKCETCGLNHRGRC